MSLSSRHLAALTSALLAVSLSANLYLFRSRPAAPPEHATASAAHGAADEPDEPRAAAEPSCAAELDACRRATSGLALGMWQTASQAAAAAANDPGAAAGADDLGAGRAVCRVARQKLREQWLEKRAPITAIVAHDLADPVKQQADAQRDAVRAADALGLDGQAREGFEQGFVDLHQRKMQELASAVAGPNVDWRRILDGAKTMFDDEDALVEQDVGAEAVARYKAAQSDSRVTILTLAATYAGVDWDEALGSP